MSAQIQLGSSEAAEGAKSGQTNIRQSTFLADEGSKVPSCLAVRYTAAASPFMKLEQHLADSCSLSYSETLLGL